MNIVSGGRIAAFAAICALASVSAHAGTVLNIPAAQAIPSADSSNCDFWIDTYSSVEQPAGFCRVEFPLTLPAGTTIEQIAVIHGTSYPLLPQPTISVLVRKMGNDFVNDQSLMFSWNSTTPVPNNVLAKSNMMAQFGKIFPDAFVVQSDAMYQVEVTLHDWSYVTGLQITYL
jgi:hypothetical protein